MSDVTIPATAEIVNSAPEISSSSSSSSSPSPSPPSPSPSPSQPSPSLLTTSSSTLLSSNNNNSNNNNNNNNNNDTNRKVFFSQFTTRRLWISTARISTIQASQIYINYINDQLNYESQTETEVDNNTLTYQQASDKNDIWRRREWYKRWRMYPKRVLHSLVRFHSVTLMQRSFEMIISSDNSNGSGGGNGGGNSGGDGKETGRWWKVSDSTMNKLTTDTFREAKDCSKRIGTTHVVINDTNASRISNQDTNDDSSSLSTTTTTTVSASTSAPSRYYNTMDYGKEMVITCLMAGLIPYLADCTVQQLLLFGRYYYNNYYKARRGSSNNNSLIKNVDDEDKDKSGDDDNDNHDDNHNTIDNNDVHKDGNTQNKRTKNKDDNEVLLTSLIVPSIKISVSRILGLCMASLGGALGSIYYPGWGTLIGSSAGDAFSSAMMDA